MKNAAKQDGRADFFLLLGGAASSAVGVEDAKFVGGSEGLKGFADALKSVGYGQRVPDDTPVKALRRGTPSCSAAEAECTLLLSLPEDVKSVD